MKNKKSILLILIVAVLLIGCGETVPAAPEPSPEATADVSAPAETAAPADTAPPAETVSPVETPAPSAPAVEVKPALTNVWDIMDNEGVEEIELLRGLEIDDIDAWQKNSPFKEIKLYQRTVLDSIRLGLYGDIVVAQFAANPFDPNEGNYYYCDWSSEPIWNVRMEKADSIVNNTGIEIPEDAWYAEYPINLKNGETMTVVCYDWPTEGSPEDTSKPVKTIEMFFAYFEDTGNLYTIYSDDTVYTWNGQHWDNNIRRVPDVVLYYIKADGADYYKHTNVHEMQAAAGRNDIRYFRIKMPFETKTYQYVYGSTLEQWVNSKYNTDGWKYDSKDPYIVTSADGQYKLNKDAYVWRTMSAELHMPVSHP